MKILVTNHHLQDWSGSELFVCSLVKELKKLGHIVYVFSPVIGEIAEEIKKLEIPVVDDLRSYQDIQFDIIHAQHNTTAILARSMFPETPMIFMSHGFLPELEQPPSIELGIAKYVVVSEEIKSHLIETYNIPKEEIEIVYNFVDTDRFCNRQEVNAELKNVLVISNHFRDDIKNVIVGACQELNLNLIHAGLPENPVRNVETYINQADLVISIGRGVLEAMACERNVIVYDIHGGDGFLTPKLFLESRKNNLSGRKYKKIYTISDFIEMLLLYTPSLGENLRKIIEKEYTAEIQVIKLVRIYQTAIASKKYSSVIKSGELFNEIAFLETSFYVVSNLQKHIHSLDQIIFNLSLEIKKRDDSLKEVFNSLSWRLTRPLHCASDFLKGLVRWFTKSKS